MAQRAHLPKDRVSLSFLLMGRKDVPEPNAEVVRVVSDEFGLDGGGRGRYGCTAEGLVVLTGRGPTSSGELLTLRRPDASVPDPRSGAPLVPLAGDGTRGRRHRR